jgi:hypothetical protein
MPISTEIYYVKFFNIDLEPIHSNVNAKIHDKVDIRSYLKSLIFVNKQLKDVCTVSH